MQCVLRHTIALGMGTFCLAIQLECNCSQPSFYEHSPSRSTTHTSLYTEVHAARFARYPNTNLFIRNLPNKVNVLKYSSGWGRLRQETCSVFHHCLQQSFPNFLVPRTPYKISLFLYIPSTKLSKLADPLG